MLGRRPRFRRSRSEQGCCPTLERCMALYRDDLLDGLVLREELYDEWAPRRTASVSAGQPVDVIERLAVTLAATDRPR